MKREKEIKKKKVENIYRIWLECPPLKVGEGRPE